MPTAKAVLPLVLRKDDHIVLAVFDEATAELKEDPNTCTTGDYRECEICFSRTDPTIFAHASTTHVRCSQVIADDAGGFTVKLLLEVEVPHVVIDMAFSPKGTYLVTYAMMDAKRTPDGNLSVFDVATGRMVRRGVQTRWPAMVWTADEEFVVRPVQGWLHILPGLLEPSVTSTSTTAATFNGSLALTKMDLMLAQDKEIEYATSPRDGLPILALFKPFYKNRPGTFMVYRLPNVRDGPLFQVPFGRSESASIHWSNGGEHVALLVKSERDPSGKSYYGTVTLHLMDVLNRSFVDVKLKGDGETVHDCQWCPTAEELLVIHGKMPRNKATLFSKHGIPLMSFGEAPRNMALWAPNGSGFVVGGSGNLAGDYQFYTYKSGSTSAASPTGSAVNVSPLSCTGEFNEKCSFHTWAPDSHNFLCATVFTRLRMDNKLVFTKNNGARVLTVKYPILYGAHWVSMDPPSAYPVRSASPRPVGEEKPKSQPYRPPGGGATRAAALLRRLDGTAAQVAKPAGPVGATVIVKKKKKGAR